MQNTPQSLQYDNSDQTRMTQGGYGSKFESPEIRGHAMRLRLKVYFGVFLVSLMAGLVLNFLRSPIYAATARVQITPPGYVATSMPQIGSLNIASLSKVSQQPVLIEMEVLNSRPLLEKVAGKLYAQGLLSNGSGDTVLMLQSMLKVSNLDGTPVVMLQAEGPRKTLLAPLINTLLDIYRVQETEAGDASSQAQLQAAKDELNVVEAKFKEKQNALDALHSRANISSGEREENQTLIRLKGLTTSLTDATDREATAAGHVRALEQAIAEGTRSSSAKDNPTVATMEARLSQSKEDWRALERQFTSKYLAMDPNAVALKVRISNLEQQLESERQKHQQSALAGARDELASAQATAQRLQQQLSNGRQEVNMVNRFLGQMQSLQDELKSLALVRNVSAQKLLELQSSGSARKPHFVILEFAVAPDVPSQPLYWRDAGLVLLASFVLGFLSVWFVEFFNRKEVLPTPPSTVLLQPTWGVHPNAMVAIDVGSNTAAPLLDRPQPQMLAHPMPRELDASEVQRLLRAATPNNLALLACLLSGLDAAEVVSLQWQHLDTQKNVLKVPGESCRELPLSSQLRLWAEITNRGPLPASGPVFTQGASNPLEVADVQAIVACSAFDSGVVEPQSITPAALRHTYVAFLVRQGLRFSELGTLVGRLSADMLNMLASLAQNAPTGSRVGVDEVQQLLPALTQ